MIIERVWAMPNKWTFTMTYIVKELKELCENYGKVINIWGKQDRLD